MNITKNGACNWENRIRRVSDPTSRSLGKLQFMQVVSTPDGHITHHVLHMTYENGTAVFDGIRRVETFNA